jgi:hypothetical protein
MSPLPRTSASARPGLVVQSGSEVYLRHLTMEEELFVPWQTGLLSICLRLWRAAGCHKTERSSTFYSNFVNLRVTEIFLI